MTAKCFYLLLSTSYDKDVESSSLTCGHIHVYTTMRWVESDPSVKLETGENGVNKFKKTKKLYTAGFSSPTTLSMDGYIK